MTHFEDSKDAQFERRPSVAHPIEAVNVIQNPLQALSKEAVIDDAKTFCEEKGLDEHTDLFVKAALVARQPDQFNEIDELTSADKSALDYEATHKWAGTKQLYFAMFMCALGAACQGWDQTGSNGANLSFPVEFGISRTLDDGPAGLRDSWLVGLVNSAPYAAAAVVGVWLSDPLNHYFGRRGEISIASLILTVTPIGSAFTHSWQALFAVRLVMGVGLGAKAATVAVYAAEMSPTRIRGALTMGWQLWTCFGIFLGFAANCVVKDVPRIAWRLQLASCFIPALPLIFLIFLVPESPRWLMKKNDYPKAFRSFCRLRLDPLIAARDLYYSHVLYEVEKKQGGGKSYFSRLADIFRVPRIRRSTLAASTVMIAQQMCGINIISFYSSTVFVRSGYTVEQALFASLGFGALNFVCTIPAIFLVDTFGRRSLLLSTFPFMCVFLLATGLTFLMDEARTQLRTGLIAFWIYLFTAFYSVGEGPVAFMYSAEVFPNIHREQGMAWAVCVNNFFAAILGLTFPSMERAMTTMGAFCFYAGLNAVALVWIFFWVPETKGLTLEELDQVFSVRTAEFGKYQVKTWLPWFLRRYIMWDKDAYLKPLIEKSHKENWAEDGALTPTEKHLAV
ncbi:hypothetical protein CcaverHIS002_0609330 [Cutaneotrichosporon cavernicola]|uniref:Major facilitator superfamily (MFS) profile domain-containing protein n=1 Tax=Cutaneotrichosporon cavernicola TaxID=279322 RepID=A0AA48L9J6_9TREE|nr:uncharacterized protein CcaverHIS019_0608790 [Cutaneotrichosporon cavernicola]BEI86646.1 hypothetical protein CcaverHIS002_0609330 [Cutaneotrichosporon cavernicola]BEI94420.1 hypothetical protein CcaverHIS019_0608790 [Cutaneotrichosporon cavernicola]BEJ02197.1 hypothetical protein CcaverHIS631_0608790 [Cutaneotrichosporon cavernicola]BEJ09958.1 hypothetical protein CcaverHIS641_0608730 [Cutaneotrichosporon cavernicola]